VRSDTYVYSGCPVPEGYDPLVAKLIVWAADRQSCGERLRRCLRETRFSGLNTNLPFVQQIVDEIRFDAPIAATGRGFFGRKEYANGNPIDLSLSPQATDQEYRHLAVAAAIHYLQQSERFQPTIPERLNSHWVRESRRLGE
jgi:acetyl-CoA carboxylase biotin carboxylase subunit